MHTNTIELFAYGNSWQFDYANVIFVICEVGINVVL